MGLGSVAIQGDGEVWLDAEVHLNRADFGLTWNLLGMASMRMMRDYDRSASLFTSDGAVQMPHINAQAVSREEIRAGIQRLQGLWDYFVQNTDPGAIQSQATPRPAVPTSKSSGAGATAART